jgi:hypothetical protein
MLVWARAVVVASATAKRRKVVWIRGIRMRSPE